MNAILEINKTERNLQRNLSENEKNRLLFLMELDSIGSRAGYKRGLSEFITYLRLEFSINELNAKREHINAYKNHLLLNVKNAKATINKKLAVVSSYFQYLLSKRVLEENPCQFIRRFRMANVGTSVAITREEVELLYNSMPTNKLYDLQKKTMIILLFETGMRISELLFLKIGSIKRDFGDYILEFEQKGGAIHRVVLNELALSYLGKFLEELAMAGSDLTEEKILFQTRSGRNINRKNFARLLNTLAKKAELSSEIHPHTARVSFIRQKHKENMDIYSIRKKVGHSSVRTTERYLG
ncbi:MAG: tyrosine-type recombinase/integrase [Bacteriovorax sp.]|nr:tyrosine-type recombinase/integrase [Bacteriovorax sp.]